MTEEIEAIAKRLVVAMPGKLPEMVYPDRFQVRYVSANGGTRWHKQWVNVSSALVGQFEHSQSAFTLSRIEMGGLLASFREQLEA